MDLEMPVMDGWEATRRLKVNPQTRDIPVIALSAHALAGQREKALAAGCNEFDTKPIEFDRLVATVRRVLADRKWRSRVERAPLKIAITLCRGTSGYRDRCEPE
jgi:two-component system, cell cycle response regulator DivK